MEAGYWILIACIALLVVVQLVRERRTGRRIAELEASGERMKDEFRKHESELRKYKDICRDLMDSNAEMRTELSAHGLTAGACLSCSGAEDRSTRAAEHLYLENRGLAYREGLLQGKDFSEQTLVQNLREKAQDCDVEATLLCFDSGIRMSFSCERRGAGEPVLRVILRVPEGGSCCIYEDGIFDRDEDWPPVRACVDTMFARGREVYLSYDFGCRRSAGQGALQ